MKKIGDTGEIIAIKYLQKKGYKICDANYKFGRFGEIDIIASLGKKYYFFEVKYRSHLGYGYPEESITSVKLRKCLRTMQVYCKNHAISLTRIQFDVLTILKMQKVHRVTHYKNIEL